MSRLVIGYVHSSNPSTPLLLVRFPLHTPGPGILYSNQHDWSRQPSNGAAAIYSSGEITLLRIFNMGSNVAREQIRASDEVTLRRNNPSPARDTKISKENCGRHMSIGSAEVTVQAKHLQNHQDSRDHNLSLEARLLEVKCAIVQGLEHHLQC